MRGSLQYIRQSRQSSKAASAPKPKAAAQRATDRAGFRIHRVYVGLIAEFGSKNGWINVNHHLIIILPKLGPTWPALWRQRQR